MISWRNTAVATALASLLVGGIAIESASADVIASGHLVRVEAREIYFTLGGSEHLSAGDKLRIKRPVKLKHPITRKMIVDWLPVGNATVRVVGSQLSMAKLDEVLIGQVRVGDRVEVLVPGKVPAPTPVVVAPKPQVPKPAPRTPVAGPLPPELNVETARVLAAWRSTSGRTLAARIAIWEGYLQRSGKTPHAAAIRQDIVALRRLRDQLRAPELVLGERRAQGLRHVSPSRALAGEALQLAFVADTPGDVAAAWLHYRTQGSATFSRAPLQPDGDGYFRGLVPSGSVAAPGVEYFVELAMSDGFGGAAVGSANEPTSVVVAPPPLAKSFEAQPHRSRVSLATTYLDFATFDKRDGDRTDRFVLIEADFFYRLRRFVYGVRAGFGVLNGEGGFIDEPNPNGPQKAGFNFGYAELEFRGPHQTAWMTRFVAGVGRDGFGTGIDLRFRIGDEEGTNLMVGIESIAEIGFLTEMRMQWNALPNFPLGLSVGATDQPGQGDVGVRLTTDLGWRALDWVTPTVRVSYQARTVDHAGIGAGIGLVFDW